MRMAHSQRWAEAFAARGDDVHVLTPHPHPAPGLAQYPLPRLLRTSAAVRIRATVVSDHLRAPVWAHRFPADVYHLHSFLPTVLGFWSFRWPQPLVVSAWGVDAGWYGPGPRPARRAAVLRFLFRQAAVLTLTSEMQREVVAPFLPPGLEPQVINWGVDAEVFQPGPVPVQERRPVVGYLKGFRAKYAPDVLVRAIPRVVEQVPEVQFRLVGLGPMREECERTVRESGVAASVTFSDPVPKEQVPRFWDDIAVGVLCSRNEEFGVASLETQACGVPVVITDIPGVRETGGPGSGTLAVPPEDSQALADGIIRLLRDPAERGRLGAQGREHVLRRHTWARTVDRMAAVYEQVQAAQPPRA